MPYTYMNSPTADFAGVPFLRKAVGTINSGASKVASAVPEAVATVQDGVDAVKSNFPRRLKKSQVKDVPVVDAAVSKVPDTPAPVKKKGWGEKLLGGDTQEGIPKAGLLDKVLAAGTVASIPMMAAPLFIPDANTRAIQAMRTQDAAREAAGLSQLAATPQMIAEKAEAAKTALSNTFSNSEGVRVTNPPSNIIPPPPLRPGSMMQQ